MIPKRFHAYESVELKRIVEELMSLEHWQERYNGLQWTKGVYVRG